MIEDTSQLALQIKEAAKKVFANAGPNGRAPTDGDTSLVCPDGHPISLNRTSLMYEDATGKVFRARCSGQEFVYEW